MLVICGATATGKTKLAAHIARLLGGELVSADSRQVYRGMDLVTGKDRPDVPIWLYDVVDPDEEFSVSHWARLARKTITDISSRNKLPIVVGGTGLYINALIKPFDAIDIPPNKALREKLQTASVSQLQALVSRGDMNVSDWNNPRRLIRKIEIGMSPKNVHREETYNACIIGLSASTAVLQNRIDDRLKARLAAGMDAEVAALRSKYDPSLPSMSAIGINEHAYARRQMTWFKKQKNILWFDIIDEELKDKVMRTVTTWYED